MRLTENQSNALIWRLLEYTARPGILSTLLEALSSYNYALIGGGAVSLYSGGQRRVSRNDIDLLVDSHEASALKELMQAHGFKFLRENVFDGKTWLVFLYGDDQPSEDQEVDLALALDPLAKIGVKEARKFPYQGREVKVAPPEVLIAMKIIAGREKDHRDILYLMKAIAEDPSFSEKKARSLVQKYAPERIEEYEQLLDDSEMFDYDLLNRMG
jgi:hypothetical protein